MIIFSFLAETRIDFFACLYIFSGKALLEEQDISPDSIENLLPQTEDQHFGSDPQNFDIPFVQLEPPMAMEDYMFSLEDGEGISDLFDACDFQSLLN